MTDTQDLTDAPALPDPEPLDTEHPVEVVAHSTPDVAPPPPAAELVPYERPRALVPGQDIPIIPGHQELQGLASMAVTLAGADAVPAALRNKPNDVFQILLTARDLGVACTTAMREFHVIDGKVTLSPKVKLAMVNERGRREGWAVWPDPQNNAETATWFATRVDRPGLTFESTFTMAEAENVSISSSKKLSGKDNWQNYPKRMLSWRALGYLLDDVFPEVGTGLYSPDELGAMTDEEGNYIDVASTEPLKGTKAPRNHGPKEDDPRDALWREADPESHAELVARIDALAAAGDDVRDALVALWRPNGGDALPPKDNLLVRHQVKARAMVLAVESRVAKLEWGNSALATWDAASKGGGDGDQGARDAVQEDEVAGSAVSRKARAAEVAREAGLTPPAAWTNDVELAEHCVQEVKAMAPTDVTTALQGRQVEPKGNPQAQRRQLATLMYTERGGTTPEDDAPAAAPVEPEQQTLVDPEPEA